MEGMTSFIYRCTGCRKVYVQSREKCGKCRAVLRLELAPPRDYVPGKPGGGVLDILADGYKHRPLEDDSE